MINVLQQYLTGKLIHEEHPTIEYSNCTNNRQHRKACIVCRDVCPKSVIGRDGDIQWEKCENCNICATQCPSRAIKSSEINMRRLLEVFEAKGEHIVVTCRHSRTADLKLFCVASVPWEVIACLALDKNVVILKQGCESCEDSGCLKAFDETIARVEEFLGAERYSKRIQIICEGELPPPAEISRRELFLLLGRKAKNVVASALSDDGSVKLDGMLYCKLLARRMKLSNEHGNKQAYGMRTLKFTEQCWGCGICVKVCPHQAITLMESDGEKYMAHALWKCAHCASCENACLEEGIKGIRVEYVTNPLEPILTAVDYGTCELCGSPVKPGVGGLCMKCKSRAPICGDHVLVKTAQP